MNFKGTYTKVPNEILELCGSGQLSLQEIRVYLFFIRNTVGWHKTHITPKNAEISEFTGINISHIPGIKRNLFNKGLLFYSKQKGWSIHSKSHSESDVKTHSNSECSGLSKSECPNSLKAPSSRVLPRGLNKELKKVNKSLYNSKILNKYLESLAQAPLKEKKERAALEGLLDSGQTIAQIEASFQIVTTRGMIGKKGEKPHSPLTYLSSVGDNLELKKAVESYLNTSNRPKNSDLNSKNSEKAPSQVSESKDQESELLLNAEKAFKIQYPSPKAFTEAKLNFTERGLNQISSRVGVQMGPAMHSVAFRLELLNWYKEQSPSLNSKNQEVA